MKLKQFQLIAFFAFFNILFSSCFFLGPSIKGNGNVTEEVRQVADFNEIKVSRGMNVYITQGSPTRVVVVADSNLHEVIQTEVHGDVLKIYADENIRQAKEKKVMVTVEKLSGVEASSGANGYTQSQFSSQLMTLHASSGANLTLDINTLNLNAKASSGANIKLAGLAKDAELGVSSGANLKGSDLKVESGKMTASSGGNVSATVIESLEARASSGGNIVYYGEPKTIDVSSSSGGNIHRK
jgi:hypothetical protein